MFDMLLRRLVDPPLAIVAARLVPLGVTADGLTLAGFVIGLAAIPDIATRHSWLGLVLVLLNRLFDGLDGAVARRTASTALGANLATVFGFVVWAGIPFAFALADLGRAVAATFLLFGFVALAAATLAAGKRGSPTEALAVTLAIAAACIFPDRFSIIAYALGILCFVFTGFRIASFGK